MQWYEKSIVIWFSGMIAMLLIVIHFPKYLEWDNFLAGLIYSLVLGILSIFYGKVMD